MRNRRGFSLLEVIVATVIFSIGALGLAATAATVTRQLGANARRADSAAIARARAERAFATGCAGGHGVATLDQALRSTGVIGLHTDRFVSVISCE